MLFLDCKSCTADESRCPSLHTPGTLRTGQCLPRVHPQTSNKAPKRHQALASPSHFGTSRSEESQQRRRPFPPPRNARQRRAGGLGARGIAQPKGTHAAARAKSERGVSQRLTSRALSYAQQAAAFSLVVMLITRSKACEYFNRSAGNSLDQNKRKALYTDDMRGLQPTCEPLKLFFFSNFIFYKLV